MLNQRNTYLFLCVALILYVILRAVYVPLIHDEVATYVHYVHLGDFIPGSALVDANNHILNSLLSIGFDRLLGTGPLALRMSNMLAFIILALYVHRWAFSLREPVLRWAFILAIVGSHYLIEFYSLSRGYGISIAAMLGLLWHTRQYLGQPSWRDLVWSLIWSSLVLGANLSLLFVVMICFVLLLFKSILSRVAAKHYIIHGMLLIGIAATVVLGFALKQAGALYYGQGEGFWSVTVLTLTELLTGEHQVWPYLFSAITLFSLLLWPGFKLQLSTMLKPDTLFHTVLFGSLLGIAASHFLFGANYPEDRVALYLFPLLMGAFIMSLSVLSQRLALSRYLSLLLCYFPVHFLATMNLTHTDFWFQERVPTSFYEILDEASAQSEEPLTLSGYQTTALAYFMAGHLGEYDFPAMASHDFPSSKTDYVLARGYHHLPLDLTGLELLATDSVSGNTLWKRPQAHARMLISSHENPGSLDSEALYLNLMKAQISANSAYVLEFDISYTCPTAPADVNMIIETKNSQGERLLYITHYLGWRHDSSQLQDSGALVIEGSGQGPEELICYLWNRKEQELVDIAYQLRLLELYEEP